MTGTTFVDRICKAPHVHDAQAGSEARRLFTGLGGAFADLVAGAAGGSPYLFGLMEREASWLVDSVLRAPESVMQDILRALDRGSADTLGAALRQAKRRVALITALADLGGVWDLEAVTDAMTDLADYAVATCLRQLVRDEITRGKLPGATDADIESGAGMVVLAMGKMGARELNYSSDIDLICLFDDARYQGSETEARAAFIRVTRKMTALLSDLTADGYVFRTDLRLRPDASVMPVCLSMTAAENYYESEGRTWERAAYIKARACAGDLAAGARFLAALTPFVWRKHLDFAAIQDAHDMRLRIRGHRKLHGRLKVEGHDLKLGQGGIREIEFFTQTRQLIAGGRDPTLRSPQTLQGLAGLAAAGWIPDTVAEELTDHYRMHRMVEHRLQMVGDAQTHALPTTEPGIARIAALCGLETAVFQESLLARLDRVETLTGAFFQPSAPVPPAQPLSVDAARIVEGWQRYPALRSDRARTLFDRLLPGLLARLDQASDPQEALVALDGFLQGLPSGVQIFSLFDANPSLIDLIVDIAATAPALARYLARNASVLDAVIGGAFFAPWPAAQVLQGELAMILAKQADYEAKLDSARRWLKEAHFRVGVHHLRGLVDAHAAGAQYADLAGAVLSGLWPVVVAAFSDKHGPPPGRGAMVLGMGSLGAGQLNASSDLDLIVLYDAAGAEASEGPRPLATRTYFARLTQALVTAITAPMAEGRLYEVDMRLRPSGRQGPVATSLQGFCDYQLHEAWTWEHLALTRARPIAGDAGLAGAIDAFRDDLLAQKSGDPAIAQDVADMRARLQLAKPLFSDWETKNGPGRLMDIELAAEALALWSGSRERGVVAQIRAGIGSHLSQNAAQTLIDAYTLFWTVHCGARLLTHEMSDIATLGGGGRAFLLRDTGLDTLEGLASALGHHAAAVSAVIDELLAARGALVVEE